MNFSSIYNLNWVSTKPMETNFSVEFGLLLVENIPLEHHFHKFCGKHQKWIFIFLLFLNFSAKMIIRFYHSILKNEFFYCWKRVCGKWTFHQFIKLSFHKTYGNQLSSGIRSSINRKIPLEHHFHKFCGKQEFQWG